MLNIFNSGWKKIEKQHLLGCYTLGILHSCRCQHVPHFSILMNKALMSKQDDSIWKAIILHEKFDLAVTRRESRPAQGEPKTRYFGRERDIATPLNMWLHMSELRFSLLSPIFSVHISRSDRVRLPRYILLSGWQICDGRSEVQECNLS